MFESCLMQKLLYDLAFVYFSIIVLVSFSQYPFFIYSTCPFSMYVCIFSVLCTIYISLSKLWITVFILQTLPTTTYELEIVAKDMAGSEVGLTGTATATITITDKNDHAPEFTHPLVRNIFFSSLLLFNSKFLVLIPVLLACSFYRYCVGKKCLFTPPGRSEVRFS